MQILKSIGYIILTLFKVAVSLCQKIWLLITDMIDDEDYEEEEPPSQDTTWFNYRTGEADPVKRFNGLYDSKDPYDDL